MTFNVPFQYDGKFTVTVETEDGDYSFRTAREVAEFIVRATGSQAALVDALDRLAGEVSGCVEMARECIGNTNAHVLWRKVQSAHEALKASGVAIDDRKLVRAMVGSGDYREEEARAVLAAAETK